MQTLKNSAQFYVWAQTVRPLLDPAADHLLSMLSDLMSNELWALCVLRTLTTNDEVQAKTTKKGNLRLKSTAEFERGFGCRIAATLPGTAFPVSALKGSSAFPIIRRAR